ncbi:Clavaminate synthase-like protein [Rhizodiscina lignyota]|uniref:Clavaminate synthase-like protein n=1 Tax=Rhizodiscina lignyota TaxID=1504668 RepID=A0A9P4IJN5_9PEZI|nr:Clavaminate synthase-like protein [Rhizodiscina lignyota]
MSNSEESNTTSPVTVSLKALKDATVTFQELEEAFGPDSLGIIVVKDLPEKFVERRAALLSYASYLANLSKDQLDSLESPESKWLVGWSCGKETLKDGRYDTLKGSYYVNCAPAFEDPSLQAKIWKQYPGFPQYTAPNVWPAEEVLPGFELAFRDLCNLIIDTAVLVAQACDRYATAKIDDYKAGCLEHVVRTSVSTKARLLHYFPSKDTNGTANGTTEDEDDWCATHLDHGALTGLTSAMFVDEDAHTPKLHGVFEPLSELEKSPDPRAGLYIRSRTGETTKVSIPRDCLAFQTGEALEVITKGQFRAVPHFVQGAASGKGGSVARNTLAVFTQPNLWEMVDEKRDFATFAKEIVERNH